MEVWWKTGAGSATCLGSNAQCGKGQVEVRPYVINSRTAPLMIFIRVDLPAPQMPRRASATGGVGLIVGLEQNPACGAWWRHDAENVGQSRRDIVHADALRAQTRLHP